MVFIHRWSLTQVGLLSEQCSNCQIKIELVTSIKQQKEIYKMCDLQLFSHLGYVVVFLSLIHVVDKTKPQKKNIKIELYSK